MSLLDDVSIVVTPNGYKAGELYAVLPVPTEGSEVVVNTDFATDTWWTVETPEVQILSNEANFNTSLQNYGIYRNSLLTSNQQYKVVFTINNYTSGAVHLNIGGSVVGSYNEAGTYTVNVSGGGSGVFGIQSDSGGAVLTVNSVSAKELTSADMDVTRATAATRVDEDGLVNYAEIIGSEEVSCGDFECADPDSVWSRGTGWTISGGVATQSSGNGQLSQTGVLIADKTYYVTVVIDSINVGGELSVVLGSGATSLTFTESGTKTGVAKANEVLYLLGNAAFSGSISNISVKEVTRDNVPRIDYTGGGCPHILAEPMRTNLITYSEDFSDSGWDKGNVTVTSDSTNSLDGTQNADLLLETSANDRHIIWDAATVSGGDFTISIFLKKQNNRYVFFQSGADNASVRFGIIYDFDDEVVTDTNSKGSPTNTSYKVEQHINGWVRLSITQTHTSGSAYLIFGGSDSAIPTYNASLEPTYTGNTSNGFYAWGAQLEVGSYPTSYIPTDGGTVTRNQDIFTRDGIGSLINSTEGVLFVEMSALANDGTNKRISLSDGTNTNRVVIAYSTSNNIQIFIVGVPAGVFAPSESIDITLNSKIAVSWSSTEARFYVDGSPILVTSGDFSYPSSTLSELKTEDGAGGNKFFGKVRQLQVYNTALSDEQLLQLTGESGTDFYESYAEMASALTYTIQ